MSIIPASASLLESYKSRMASVNFDDLFDTCEHFLEAITPETSPRFFDFFKDYLSITPDGIRALLTRKLEKKKITQEQRDKIQIFTSTDEFLRKASTEKTILIGIIRMESFIEPTTNQVILEGHYTTCIALGSRFLLSDSVSGYYQSYLASKIRRLYKKAEICKSDCQRQKDSFHCWVFALEDALYFAKLPLETLRTTFFANTYFFFPPQLSKGHQNLENYRWTKENYPEFIKKDEERQLRNGNPCNAHAFFKALKYASYLLKTDLFLFLHPRHISPASIRTVRNLAKRYPLIEAACLGHLKLPILERSLPSDVSECCETAKSGGEAWDDQDEINYFFLNERRKEKTRQRLQKLSKHYP